MQERGKPFAHMRLQFYSCATCDESQSMLFFVYIT